jgi:hypothetical protein
MRSCSGVLPIELAWRMMFWIELLPSLLAVWIEHHVAEPEVFETGRNRRASESPVDFLHILSLSMLPTTLLAS